MDINNEIRHNLKRLYAMWTKCSNLSKTTDMYALCDEVGNSFYIQQDELIYLTKKNKKKNWFTLVCQHSTIEQLLSTEQRVSEWLVTGSMGE